MFLVSRKGTGAGSACGRDEYSPGEKRRQEDKPAGGHDTRHRVLGYRTLKLSMFKLYMLLFLLTLSSTTKLKSKPISKETPLLPRQEAERGATADLSTWFRSLDRLFQRRKL